MAELNHRGVEEILVEKNLLTVEKLQGRQVDAAKLGRPVGDLISERNLVSPEDFAQALGEVLGVPFVKLTGMDIPAEILNLIPQNTASRYVLIPFEKTDSTLKVAMSDPLDLQVIGFLERRRGLKIETHIAPAKEIVETIEHEYRKTLGGEGVAALEEAGGGEPLEVEEVKDIERESETIRKSPVAAVVSSRIP